MVSRRIALGVERQLRLLRRFVGREVDAGETLDDPSAGLDVQALGIASFAGGQRSANVDFDELALRGQRPRQRPIRPEGRNERGNDDQSGIGEQCRHFANPADALDAIILENPQIGWFRPWRILSPSSK